VKSDATFYDMLVSVRGDSDERELTKSARCTWPSESSSTLSGLISLCTMPCVCMYRTAQPSCAIQNRTASSVKVFREIWKRRSPPFIRSTTMYLAGCQLDIHVAGEVAAYRYSMSWKLYRRLQRKGWLRCSSMRRSRMMLRTLSERTTVTQRQRRAPRRDMVPRCGRGSTHSHPS
jgi:hypothetical protein